MKWLSDTPIESHLDDKFSFNKSSTVLQKFITNSDTPISIGINGKWGSGKTSLMRLIKEGLEKDAVAESNISISWFDTWNFSHEKEIWRVMMISIIDDLGTNNKNTTEITKLISGILDLGFITSTAWLSSGATIYSDKDKIKHAFNAIKSSRRSREDIIIRDKLKTVKTFKEELEKLIEQKVGENGKLVIFIDDLDRIVPEKVVEIIEAIKTFFSCKGCVFVLGCDQDYLEKCIENKYKGLNFNGKDYIEKIIQIPFDVPSITPNFDSFLFNCTFDYFNLKDDFITIGNLVKKSIEGENPRQIKRLINLFNIIYVLNENELDDIVLFKLLCYMLKWPDLYNKSFKFYYQGENKFAKYSKWARPTMSFDEFTGYTEMETYVHLEQEPPDLGQEHDHYIKNKMKIDDEVDVEFKPNETESNINAIKDFLNVAPYFDQVENLDKYLVLLESIDQISTEISNDDLLKKMINVSDIDDLIKKIIKCFEGQIVKGMYFNKSNNVILPKSSTIREIPFIRMKNDDGKYEWGYEIINNKSELSKYHFDRINYSGYKMLWIISPWKIPKSIIEFTQGKSNILISDVSLLQKMLEEFKQRLV